jgi:NADPH:quinone reductase-like Zn-dependent oxidoreductase
MNLPVTSEHKIADVVSAVGDGVSAREGSATRRPLLSDELRRPHHHRHPVPDEVSSDIAACSTAEVWTAWQQLKGDSMSVPRLRRAQRVRRQLARA